MNDQIKYIVSTFKLIQEGEKLNKKWIFAANNTPNYVNTEDIF